MQASAANARASVVGAATGQTTFEITNGGTTTLNAADNNLTVRLDAASTLTLNKMAAIHAIGSGGNDTIIAGAAGQVLTGGAGTDTLWDPSDLGVIFRDAAAGLNGDTLRGFNVKDQIDLTDINSNAAKATVTRITGGYSLTVTDGTHTATMKVLGLLPSGSFHTASDGGTGTAIKYS